MTRLCVNIDHVATLREARLSKFSLERVVNLVKKAGADGVTIHLREDRRHIQDWDVPVVRNISKEIGLSFTLEIAATDKMFLVAQKYKPELITLVPENREELTTEGGLALLGSKEQRKKQQKIIEKFKRENLKISLFVDPDLSIIREAAKILGPGDFVELHTGRYSEVSKLFGSSSEDSKKELDKLKQAFSLAQELGLKVNAGHGISKENLTKILEIKGIEELHVGYHLIYEAIFVGLENSVKDFLKIIRKSKN